MKTEIKETKKVFKPFDIIFTVETIEEARLMFKICDAINLNNGLSKNGDGDYAIAIPPGFQREIREQIELQGFDI